MLSSPRSRVAALCVLFCLLGVALAAHGTIDPDPDSNRYPDNEQVVDSYDRLVGSGVVVSGVVVETDPVVMRGTDGLGEPFELRLTGTGDLDAGDRVWLYGTARADRTVDVETAVVRSDWEILYMYVVSALGGLLVLGRFVDGWRFDASRLAFVPREGRLSSRAGDRNETAEDA